MPVVLRLEEACKAYGEKVLLDSAGLALTDAMKVGVIGRNGAGKSTLVRILVGEEELDSGTLWRHRELRLAYLRQHDPWHAGESVADFLERDSGAPDWRCGQIAGRFEIKHERLAQPVSALSGGWQTRVKLSALLLHDPDFLVLDEPTNFLDLRTQMLLEDFLAGWNGGCLLVSHDRDFLRATCDHTLAVDRGSLELAPGSVDDFLAAARAKREHARRVNAAVANKRKQLQTFVDTFRAKARRASQARSKAREIERLVELEEQTDERTAAIRVPAVEPGRGAALQCEDLAIGYPAHTVASGIDLEIEHGQRVAVVGDNGEGKTTFLRTVAGSLSARAGSCRWGHGCAVGLYAQHVYAGLDATLCVHDHLRAQAADGVTSQEIRNIAGSFLFHGDAIEMPISTLSGGERARLVLAGLLLGGHNVLILDEPSNHLDVETLDALAEALCGYAGTIVMASHDRSFIERVATGVVEVRAGAVAHFPGDYATYCYRVRQEIAAGERSDASTPTAPDPAPAAPPPAKRDYKLGKRCAALERKVGKLEAERNELEAAMTAHACDHTRLLELDQRLRALDAELAATEDEWFALQEQREP